MTDRIFGIFVSPLIRTPGIVQRYSALEKVLTTHEPYQEAISLVEFVPGDRRQRYKYIHELELPFAVELYSYHSGDHGGTLWWVWRAPADPADSDNNRSMLLAKELDSHVHVYHTRAMRRDFVERFHLVSNAHRSVLNKMYRFLTGDAAEPATQASKAVLQRLRICLDAQDEGLAFDLQEVNKGRPQMYEEFWQACV